MTDPTFEQAALNLDELIAASIDELIDTLTNEGLPASLVATTMARIACHTIADALGREVLDETPADITNAIKL